MVMKRQKQLHNLLSSTQLVYQEFDQLEDIEIIVHDLSILKGQLDQQVNMNSDLQDYITKWCHEVKMPLSALFLMVEKIEHEKQRMAMKEQLEKMKQQLNTALVGCRIQSSIYDFQIKKVKLEECVRTSIKNNQFFLIHHHFDVHIDISDLDVYTDKEWMIYVMDQLIANAIKYDSESSKLTIWTQSNEKESYLYMEDNGTGIKESDMRYIFDKGYTGSNHHNGKYKSTGMGLYLVSSIINKLGHHIKVESEFGKFTRMIIIFQDNRDFFCL